MRSSVLLACALLMSAVSLSANKPRSLDLANFVGSAQFSRVIEQQSWWLDSGTLDPNHTVVNPLQGCTWDINENADYVSGPGDLAPGASTSRTDCHVMDFDPIFTCRSGLCAWWSGVSNWLGLQVFARSGNLQASMCFQPQGVCFTGTPIYDAASRQYVTNICAQAVYQPDDPAIVDIAGSNGGRGVVTTITRTVSNPTSRTEKSVWVRWGLTSDHFTAPGCPAFPIPRESIQMSYPFRWVQ